MVDKLISHNTAESEGMLRRFVDQGDTTYAEKVVTEFLPDAALPAGEAHLGQIGGTLVEVGTGEIARPANTDAYAAKDAVGPASAILTFTNLARIAQGSGYITKARVITDLKTMTARLRLHLFNAAPTAIADNAPFLLLYADVAKRIGYIDFPAMATEDPTNSTSAIAQNIVDRLAFNCAAASRDVFGVLETLDVFVPTSAQKFHVLLTADQN